MITEQIRQASEDVSKNLQQIKGILLGDGGASVTDLSVRIADALSLRVLARADRTAGAGDIFHGSALSPSPQHSSVRI